MNSRCGYRKVSNIFLFSKMELNVIKAELELLAREIMWNIVAEL